METQTSIMHAAKEKNFMDFNNQTKAILQQKVAAKMAEAGYFDKMNQAQGNVQEEPAPTTKKD